MEQGVQETRVLEEVLVALEFEKLHLEKKLETEVEDAEREEVEIRLGEIYADLEIHKIGLTQPSSQPETEVRRSERQRKLTEKMRDFKQSEITSKERKFMSTYVNFKAEIQLSRSKLKKECSKAELTEMIKSVGKCESDLQQDYVALRTLTTPSQDFRRKMDSCSSVSTEMMLLLKRRYADVDKEFDAIAVKDSLLQLLQREDAKSMYGSTVSRAEKSSQNSYSKQGSQVSAKKAEAAARLASKRAEISREKEISAQRKEILAQQERLKLLEKQRDLEVIEAEYNVYAEEESKLNAEIRNSEVKGTLSFSQLPKPLNSPPYTQAIQSTAPPNFEGITNKIPKYLPVPKCDTRVASKESELSLVQALKESLAMTRLPIPEPFTFTGDPLKFTEWSTCFKALIETSCTNSAHKLFYLKKYINGEALGVLEGTFYRSDEEAYNQAWDALNNRYGHPFVVQRAFRGKLSSWPKIGPKESLKLREFSDFLVSCKNAMPHVQGLKVLDDCEENQKLLLKLPDWATTRWNRHVSKLLDEGKEYPGFTEFADFVAEEARIACNPVSSLFALKNTFEKPEKEQKRQKASVLMTTTNVSTNEKATAATQINKKSKPNLSSTQNKRQIECICCRQNHFIYKCDKFTAMSLEEKKQFIIDNNMCFGCLRVGHISKNCQQRVTCNVCKRKHPSPLHEDHPQPDKPEMLPKEENAATVSCSVKLDNSDCTSMIVPVWLSSSTNRPETLVYALLDTQSSNTFIDQNVCEKLQARTGPVKLKLTTITDRCSIVPSQRVEGLRVRGYHSQEYIELPPTYTREYIPLEKNSIPTRETAKKWPHLLSIANEMPDLLDCPVALLIGYDCTRALKPRKVIPGEDYDPYAVKTDLGWSIVGPIKPWTGSVGATGTCHRVIVKELPSITPASVIKALEADFLDTNPKEGNISQEDIQFLEMLNENIHYNEQGHLEMPLPFKERPQLPNNKQLATVRLKYLKMKMDKNPKYKEDYIKFMNNVFKDGDAEEAEETPQDGNTWYIPHHGVYHPRKPEKIRVVFDCSAKHEDTSLNDHLLTGPDLINTLAGVLCRFRENRIAIMCDVEKMFHRFHVNPEDRDFLRFLWWKDGNTNTEPKEYRMRVHVFGTASSPGCANFGMKHLARRNEKDYPLAASFIHKNFYVDDGLLSVETDKKAKQLVCEALKLCVKGKLRLHKFVCNNKEVMSVIPESERAGNTTDVNMNYSEVPMKSVLGVKWNVEADVFTFSGALKERPATRRGILATVASVYDPLGFLSPYTLIGKQVLQEMCKSGVGWDEPVPSALETKWKAWLCDLENLRKVEIPRCLFPENLGKIKRVELHHFSDASSSGYGQCSYIRFVTDEQVHCALVMGKARVAPIKIVTIPRLELTAAAVSAFVSNFLRAELERKIDEEFFWTDSQVTLGYIKNDARRFHVFVANRVQKIRDTTDPNQWFYIKADQNPADHASRGLKVAELINSNWLTGPKFPWEREIITNQQSPELLVGDPEVKVLKTDAIEQDRFLERFMKCSDWITALNVVARIKSLAKRDKSGAISVKERQMAASVLFQLAQKEAFEEELRWFSEKG
nr:uncharacterized protein LOC107395402 [Nothobranchius furzeri]